MIEAPTNCPSCASVLEWRNDILYCINTECEAKTHKRVEHFSKTLKIKGLGPSTIEKLYLEDINDIYELDIETITEYLQSEKLAVKLFDEIENSKNSSLNTILPAFGIPLIGKSASDKLSKVASSIFDIDEEVCKKAGIGPKATSNLISWLEESFPKYWDMPFNFEFEQMTVVQNKKGVVCISGKLKSYKTKADATAFLLELGYTVKDSLTKDVTILINESGIESTKTQKARESGVRIINNINELIGEIND